MSEKDLQDVVIRLANLLGYYVAHWRPGRTAKGSWRTPCQAQARGWPDCVIVGHGRILFRELKQDGGKLTPEQRHWLDLLQAAGADAGVWRPTDWRAGRIEKELRGENLQTEVSDGIREE